MKKTLITGIAALLLATGTAHAEDLDDDGYRTIVECNDVALKNFHLSDVEFYRVELSVEHKQKKHAPIVTFDAEKLTLFIDGKRCQKTRKVKEKDCKDIYELVLWKKRNANKILKNV
jgi:hypothetical protein